jgi:hypothetical protein
VVVFERGLSGLLLGVAGMLAAVVVGRGGVQMLLVVGMVETRVGTSLEEVVVLSLAAGSLAVVCVGACWACCVC